MTAALAAFTFFSLTPAHAALNTDERTVLVNLYNGTGGGSWIDKTNWDVSGTSDPCADKWYGVTCDAAGEHVTELDFEGNKLSGSLPDLSPLTQLVKAVFWDNNLTGTIPLLPDSLEYLDVDDNSLTGSLPLKLPASLMKFYASYNQLTGSIPELPASLEGFSAYDNQLSGPIPELPTSLRWLGVGDNQLSGSIPELPASLVEFFANNNQLSGLIPALPANLQEFYADNNQLSGPIPALPANLQDFYADNNQLSGPIPALPANLQLFSAENNFLSGSILDNNPAFSGNLKGFFVAGNFLTGLPPAPNYVAYASMCPNRLDGPGTAGAPDWSAVTWDPTTSEWTANCAPATSATVTVDNTAEGGSITCPTSVQYGDATCDVTPNTDAGYAFAKELVFDPVDAAAVESCTDTGCTILVKKDVTVKAVFTKVPDPTPTDPTPTPYYHSDSSSPTMGELGLLLSGLALAGAAAPALRRREKQGKKADTCQ